MSELYKHLLVPRDAAFAPKLEEIAGFFRFEQCPGKERNYPDVHQHFHWDPESIHTTPCGDVIAHFTNEHAGCYILTQSQLRRCLNSGRFIVEPHRGKYGLPETAATDPYTQCGFRKMICVSRFDDFLVHHLPNKYMGSQFGVSDKELRRQLSCLVDLARRGRHPAPLLNTESKLKLAMFSKNYYEPASEEVLSLVPAGAGNVLSLGCGWGATEAKLSERASVTAVPLDSIIPGGLPKGVEIVTGDLAGVLEALSGRKYDCVLLPSILHLVPKPVELLSCVRKLLSSGGTLVINSPNMRSLPITWRSWKDLKAPSQLDFTGSGVHRISPHELQRWLAASGMRSERIVHLKSPRVAGACSATFGLFDPLFSTDFLTAARVAPERS